MGPLGALIMGFFGGVFFVAASIIAGGWDNPFLAVPVLVYAVIATVAGRRLRRASPGAYEPDLRTGRIIARATIAEGVGIPIVAMALGVTGHPDLVLPGIAAVVGLHFLPMGYFIPFRPFAVIAWLLLLAAAAGMVLRQPDGAVLAGIAAALALWAASALALASPALAARGVRRTG
jgi:hypothetical protein